jgi:hypothetical protein
MKNKNLLLVAFFISAAGLIVQGAATTLSDSEQSTVLSMSAASQVYSIAVLGGCENEYYQCVDSGIDTLYAGYKCYNTGERYFSPAKERFNLKFVLPKTDSKIASARLVLYASSVNKAQYVTVFSAGSDWKSASCSADGDICEKPYCPVCSPLFDYPEAEKASSQYVDVKAGDNITFDLTSLIQSAYASGMDYVSLQIRADEEAWNLKMKDSCSALDAWSRQDVAFYASDPFQPQLELLYSSSEAGGKLHAGGATIPDITNTDITIPDITFPDITIPDIPGGGFPDFDSCFDGTPIGGCSDFLPGYRCNSMDFMGFVAFSVLEYDPTCSGSTTTAPLPSTTSFVPSTTIPASSTTILVTTSVGTTSTVASSTSSATTSTILVTTSVRTTSTVATSTSSATTSTRPPAQCTPPYEPQKWNGKDGGENNCYNYAVNVKTGTMALPGRASGYSVAYPPTGCSEYVKASESDGLRYLGVTKGECNNVESRSEQGCEHKAALFMALSGVVSDFHWYREDNTGFWSNKYGAGAATDLDTAYQKIADPETCARSFNFGLINLETFCGYFCVDNSKVTIK